MRIHTLALVVAALSLSQLSCERGCDLSSASNKMLALNKIQGRLAARGGDDGVALSIRLAPDLGAVSGLISMQKYDQACEKADGIAEEYGFDLPAEMKDMITMEQLTKDGGKGAGTCSVADAAKRQMEVHGMLQAEVDAGRRTSEVFREFSEDTKPFGELLVTNPSKACDLLDQLKIKYKL